MSDISVSAPVQPYELDKRMRDGMSSIVERVASKAIIDGRGKDLLLRIYMAGLYHGAMLSERPSAAVFEYNY